MALIFAISSIAIEAPVIDEFPFRDKGIHFVEYGILGWLCARATAGTWPGAPRWKTAALAATIATLWGLSDECHQFFVPGRSAEIGDAVADLLGAVAGAALWNAIFRRAVK